MKISLSFNVLQHQTGADLDFSAKKDGDARAKTKTFDDGIMTNKSFWKTMRTFL